MGLSETILAAIIGAIATMATAIVQILRNRAPAETRPKKNRVRSTFAIIALVFGAMVGGYFWSELRAVGAREEIAALRADLKLAAKAEIAPRPRASNPAATDPGAPHAALATSSGENGSAESVAHLPPCRVTQQAEDAGPTACTESLATTVALCATVPSTTHTTGVHVHARVPKSDTPWLERDAGAPTLGNLHIAAAHVEYPTSADRRAVCLDVSNWSVEETLAVRVVVDFAYGSAPASELTAAAPITLSRSHALGFLRDVQVGQRAFERFGRQPHRFRQRRVRMNRQADIGRVRAHLDRQRDLRDQLARVRADDAAAEHAMRLGIEQQLGEAFVATRATSERPLATHGKAALLVRRAVLLRFGLGEAHPGHFRIGVRHRRNHARIEVTLLPRGHFRRHLRLVHRLVREHRRPARVADREDVRHVGAHLLVDGNEAAVAHVDIRGLADRCACRSALRPTATSTRSNTSVRLPLASSNVTREPFGLRRAAGDLGVEQDLLVARLAGASRAAAPGPDRRPA